MTLMQYWSKWNLNIWVFKNKNFPITRMQYWPWIKPTHHVTFFVHIQLWTAPEILRLTEKPSNGTQKGDVYSIGIIMQEIVYRTMPFFIETSTPKGNYQTYTHFLLSSWCCLYHIKLTMSPRITVVYNVVMVLNGGLHKFLNSKLVQVIIHQNWM